MNRSPAPVDPVTRHIACRNPTWQKHGVRRNERQGAEKICPCGGTDLWMALPEGCQTETASQDQCSNDRSFMLSILPQALQGVEEA